MSILPLFPPPPPPTYSTHLRRHLLHQQSRLFSPSGNGIHSRYLTLATNTTQTNANTHSYHTFTILAVTIKHSMYYDLHRWCQTHYHLYFPASLADTISHYHQHSLPTAPSCNFMHHYPNSVALKELNHHLSTISPPPSPADECSREGWYNFI